jgi:hypothetical protein
VEEIVSRQYAQIKEANDRVKNLRDAAKKTDSTHQPKNQTIKRMALSRRLGRPRLYFAKKGSQAFVYTLGHSYVQLRMATMIQKAIKITRSQSKLRAIGTERLNFRFWRIIQVLF